VDEDHLVLVGFGRDAGVELGVDHRQAIPEVGGGGRGLEQVAPDIRSTTPEARSDFTPILVGVMHRS